jgi:hypothetical protein
MGVSLRFGMRRNLLVLFLAYLAVACVPTGHTLSVDVITDIVPGPEFDLVSVALFPPGTTRRNRMNARELREENVALADSALFRRGRRVADFSGTPEGAYSLRLQLLSPLRGAIVIERWSSLVVRGPTRVLIDLDSRCIDVMCPAPMGSESFTECSQGRCVDPVCNLDDPSTWVEHCCDPNDPRVNCALAVYCTDTADCASRNNECSTATCEQRLCLNVALPGACPENSYCAQDGCRPVDIFDDDAGVPDASRADAAVGPVDAGALDAHVELDSASAMPDSPPPSVDAPLSVDAPMTFPDAGPRDTGETRDAALRDAGVDAGSDGGVSFMNDANPVLPLSDTGPS